MKKLICIILALLLTGCAARSSSGRVTADLMPGAKPETSALALYIYDGETVTRQFLFETEEVRREAMADFREASVTPTEVDVTTLQPPYYGLEMGGEELGEIHGIWADGYFIRNDGTAYEFDYDFEELLTEYVWEDSAVLDSLSFMPCAGYLAKTEIGWNPNFLTPAEAPSVDPVVTMELVKADREAVLVRYTNGGDADWMYGNHFRLETCLNGTWYRLPSDEPLVFTEEGLILPAHGEGEESYSLWAFHTLPAGDYRLINSEGMAVEFYLD